MQMQPDIDALMALDEEALLAQLGKELAPPGFGSSPRTPVRNRLTGKQWMVDNRIKLAKLICSSTQYDSTLPVSNSTMRRAELVAVIADIISSQFIGIPVFIVSVLLVKEGLHTLCGDNYVDRA